MQRPGWGGGRTRTASPMESAPLHPPRPLPLGGACLAPPPASHRRPVPRPALAPRPPKSFPSVLSLGLPGRSTRGTLGPGEPPGAGQGPARARRSRGAGTRGGGRPGGGGEGGGGRASGSGRAAGAGERCPRAVSMAVRGAAGGKPTPAPSPAASSLAPAPCSGFLSPPARPSSPATCCFCPGEPGGRPAGGRSRVTLPLHPKGRGAPGSPAGLPRSPVPPSSDFSLPFTSPSVLQILPVLLPL